MLIDKSGLRQKPGNKTKKKKKKGGGFKQKGGPSISPQEKHEQAIRNALNYGIGYNQYKKEVDAIRAARIREKREKH